MGVRLIICVVIAGCGYPALPALDRDGGDDIDSSSCFPRWLDHTVQISASTVREITELSSSGTDRNPWISGDGLRMYFSREVGAPDTADIYIASRASTTQPFSSVDALGSVNSAARDTGVSLTSDELTLFLSTDRKGHLDIQFNTRAIAVSFGPPDDTYMGMVNAAGTQRNDPWLSADGLRLYLAADTGPANQLQLQIATRTDTTEDFGAPALIPGAVDNVKHQGDPKLYHDERLLVFSSFSSGGVNGELSYATRSNAGVGFGPPLEIPGVATPASEIDPVLSADGCEVYFASTRRGGQFHLFRAQVTR